MTASDRRRVAVGERSLDAGLPRTLSAPEPSRGPLAAALLVHEPADVDDGAEVLELVRLDHRADSLDGPRGRCRATRRWSVVRLADERVVAGTQVSRAVGALPRGRSERVPPRGWLRGSAEIRDARQPEIVSKPC